MKQIGRGRTADIFEYGENKILKLYRKGFPEDFIQREFDASQFVCSLGIPSPHAYELARKEGRLGIVFDRVNGVSMLSAMSKNVWLLGKHSTTLAALHYDLHTQSAPGRLRKQKAVLSEHIQAAQLLTEEEKGRILRYLKALPDDDKLCHGDFHPDNVLVGDGIRIIDWMTGMSGNPAGDAARSILLLSYGTMPDGTPNIVKAIVQFMRNKIRKGYTKHYLELSGQPYSNIDSWMLPVAAARLVEWIPPAEKNSLLELIRERLGSIPM
ncbi:phosphotransferase family protein [Paenibacillus allorhizosphaerae]|uniref:Aminoglycoside phosphotransferase domain-containing protein n=1 Tax=Paenibacillus allorhizosphaerae TaxID=2849866 RepID=A0ABN7TFK4_9BACL|nr:aminoglycoside phosphotransferase family protein [Paenibacillus allorhizosphaerae]CAG7618241.1 hypothetical protein PAECIP111802_00499 [Paenibacillus allorhizosphaerae]